jgi:hypothetical protein
MKENKTEIKELNPGDILVPLIRFKKIQDFVLKVASDTNVTDRQFSDLEKDVFIRIKDEDFQKVANEDMLTTYANDTVNYPKLKNENGEEIEVVTRSIAKTPPAKTLKNGKTKNISFSYMGVAIPVQIPLWHSGFRIAIDLTEPNERLSLMNSLRNTLSSVGINTIGLMYSNEGFVLEKIIWEFIEDKIVSSTVKVKNVSELKELIDYRDWPFILNGLVKSITPKGFDITVPCSNFLEYDEDGNPIKCNNISSLKVDAEELERVAINKFPNKALLTVKQKDGLSKAEVLEYQKELADRKTYTYEVYGGTIDVTFKFPNLTRKFDLADMWITELEEDIDEALRISSKGEQEAMIGKLIDSILLGIYAHMVEEIKLGDARLVGDEDIYMNIKALSADPKVKEQFIEDIKEYINEHVYAIIGAPAYTCSKCKQKKGEDINEDLTDIVPLNLMKIFFDLGTYLELKQGLA